MKIPSVYRDRREAGLILAEHVVHELEPAGDVVILALPRGGVPVALEVARALGAPLDVFLVRKLGAPGQEEFAIGAIAAGGFEVLNRAAIEELGLSQLAIARIADRETTEMGRRERLYRGNRAPACVRGQTAILIDDGLATGFTMRAAISAVRACEPARLIVAAPVGAPDTCQEIEPTVDALICPLRPESFQAVGAWYRDFTPTTDEEVRGCLATAAMERGEASTMRAGRI